MHRKNVWLIAILWLALALRLFRLGEQSLWYDEGVTWYLTRFSLPELARWTAADIQPPLYYLIVWGAARLFGQSEWALRFPSAAAGALAVPLLWQMARRLFRRGTLAAALFGAVAPLMVYYGQEARMYTLLAAQATLASWLLLRVAGGAKRRFAVAYTLVMASALYTHYFAAFLLLAHALYIGVLLLRRGESSPPLGWRRAAGMFGGVALLFAPWTPVLPARLGDDPSYWPGALKLAEVVQDVFISFAVGGKREMILEAHGLPLAAGFGLLLLANLFLLLKTHRRPDASPFRPGAPAPLLFLLLWLVVPVALVLLLSYRTPKFNPRYTMLAWPAFALIQLSIINYQLSISRYALRITRYAVILFIASSWAFSLGNWFFDPRFSKDDFKHAAQFIRERFTPGDTVLLSSGHFFPVWQYYYGPDGWTPLPKMETLDARRVTGFDITSPLAGALRGHSGAWLVTWQDEVIDPNGVVPLLLDAAAERQEDEFHAGDFWGVGLHYWRLPDRLTFSAGFPADVRTDFNFGNLVTLRGLAQSKEDETEAILFWEARRPLSKDYLISLRLLDAEGVPWSDGARVARPAAYLYPTPRWEPGRVVAGRQPLPFLTGAPPGEYWLEVGWLTPGGEGVDVLDAAGNPQGRTVRLGPVRLAEPVGGAAAATDEQPLWQREGLALLSAAFEAPAVEAGSRVILDSVWRVTEGQSPAAGVRLAGWRGADGRVFPLEPPRPIPADYPPGTVFRARPKLPTPPNAEAGVRAGITHILFAVRPEEEAAAIDEYLKSLRPVPSPHLVDGNLSP
ncbi:MAG: glycosyltransferase family 39 protein, partial [Anaerolineae bacterium]